MDWRARILDRFPAGAYELTVADDPDGILLEEGVQAALAARGHTLLSYGDLDPLAFRLIYEEEHRPWAPGDAVRALVLRAPEAGLNALPHDVLRRARHVRLSLDEVFPGLHYGTVRVLPPEALDRLAHAVPAGRHAPLGERETVAFALRHVYDADPYTVRDAEGLLAVLLRLHYRGERLPEPLDRHFIDAVRGTGAFERWPLERVVGHRDAFFAFLQERWPLFVQAKLGPPDASDAVGEHRDEEFSVPGPPYLPLDREGVRVYVDNLFLEGFLRPVEPPCPIEDVAKDAGWMVAGLVVDPERDRARRIRHLVDALGDRLPAPDAPHTAWTAFAQRWGELVALHAFASLEAEEEAAVARLTGRLDARFREWALARYDALRTIPGAMLHHVPGALARQLENAGDGGRVALVLLDGLAFTQWAAIAPVIERLLPDARLSTGGVFAWLPTVTPVSRQAAFSGQPPYYFAGTISQTRHDGAGWERFWSGRGLPASAARYLNVAGDDRDLAAVASAAEDHRVRALGLVVGKVDDVVHGAALGARSALSEARQWAEGGWLVRALSALLGAGFEVTITSDHGNVEARGIGRPRSGVLAAERGERVRVYEAATARAGDAAAVPGAVAWTPSGLPPRYEPLFAPPRSAFVPEGRLTVAHGGLSLEEVVVPLVRVRPAPP